MFPFSANIINIRRSLLQKILIMRQINGNTFPQISTLKFHGNTILRFQQNFTKSSVVILKYVINRFKRYN